MADNETLEKALSSLPDEEEPNVVAVDINGREVFLRPLSSVQFMQLQHEAFLLEKDATDIGRKRKGLDRVFRTMRSAIVSDEDKEYVEDLIADGELGLRALVRSILRAHADQPDETPVAVRRSRTSRKR